MGCPEARDELPRRLRDDLANRRIAAGIERLRAHQALFESLDPADPRSPLLLGYLAQWVDAGFGDPGMVKSLLARFPRSGRASLPLVGYLHLRMAEGLVAMAGEDFDAAIRHFEFVGSVEEEIRDSEILAISNFWIGGCLRKQGRYDDALSYTVKARDLALELGCPKMAAVMRVMESWLIFQKGRLKEASAILREAEAALNDTDDYITRGNIQSAYGRIARREGHYERALEYFEKAIAEYRKHDPHHRNLARSLVNRSFAKRLIALGLQEKLDREAAHRKAGGARSPGEARHRGGKARLEDLRREAVEDLDTAYEIYAAKDNHRGMGAVKINYGLLHLDGFDLDHAAAEAAEAYTLGEEKHDHILMARARILQCMIEEARFEEQIEDAEEPGAHARRAHEYSAEALELARQTQNRRLLARAYVWRGLTFSNEFVNNLASARECCDAAIALLRPDAAHDYTWKDLQELRSRILDKSRVDTALREWSQGLVGDKSLQQLTEEFAGIVIPRVWECEERKISRVAARLSVSPKKVRRILHARGLLGEAR